MKKKILTDDKNHPRPSASQQWNKQREKSLPLLTEGNTSLK